jgi:hypothetical protein
MAYPPRTAAAPPAAAAPQRSVVPPHGHAKIERPRVAAETARFDSRPAVVPAPAATAAAAPAAPSIRRGVDRPTPANEPAYRKTG